MDISYRLAAIADMVLYDSLVDVGCDHALLPIYLAKKGIVNSAIAADLSRGGLDAACKNISKHGLEDIIETALSDGLNDINTGLKVCVIAGIGGQKIMQILSDNLKKAKSFEQLILSPQSELSEVRKYLDKSGFTIVDEICIKEDGKFYFIMDIRPFMEVDRHSVLEYSFGKHNLRRNCPVLREYIIKEIMTYQQIFDEMPLGHPVLQVITHNIDLLRSAMVGGGKWQF